MYHFAAHPIRSRNQITGPYQIVTTYPPTTTGTINGRAFTPDLLVTGRAGCETEIIAARDYRSVLFFVPPPEVEDYFENQDVGPHFLVGELDSVSRLYRWGRDVVRAAEQGRELFDESRHLRAGIRRELIERLGEALASSRSFFARDQELTSVNHSRLVRKVQDYALEHIDDRPYLKDLCQEHRVSERTLRYAFQHVLGMSPVAFLSRLRLHRVHTALTEAAPGTTTVTMVALDWGFWHAGDFAKAYQECFGELPSDTLSRGA